MTSIKSPLSLRDLFWLVLVAAVAVGWWTQHRNAQPMPTVQPMPESSEVSYHELNDTVTLVTSYLKSWGEGGAWPKPGTFTNKNLIYVGTQSDPLFDPGRRRDIYHTSRESGYELYVFLHDDGRVEVAIIDESDCETC